MHTAMPQILSCLLFFLISSAAGQVAQGRVLKDTYDYVVVGCGVAGLVVATRLSENPNITVLCLEAGALDNYEEYIQFPNYIGEVPYGFYAWELTSVPQLQLDGRPRPVPMGKGVGGGSLINGMIWNRGDQADYNAWEQLGNPGWGWDDLLPYFRKSETFTPKYYPNQRDQPCSFDPNVHGYEGPVQVSYPNYYWEQSNNWFDALNELGVPTTFDPNEGLTAGGYYLPQDIDAENQTRSDTRRVYYDPAANRSNFDLVYNAQVTKILFNESNYPSSETGSTSTSSPAQAMAVQFYFDSAIQEIAARREVILAAGAIHTPQLLELSGIGSSSILSPLNITTIVDLPGVGNNLQDHAMVSLNYSYQAPNLLTPQSLETNSTFNAYSQQLYLNSKTGPWTGKPSTTVAFPSLGQILPQSDVIELVGSVIFSNTSFPETYETTLKAGYYKQLDTLLACLLLNTTPAFEILNDNSGGLDLSVQHPLSRGTVHINSTDLFDQPVIDPRWLTHPFDASVLIAGMEFNQRLLSTTSLSALTPSYDQIPFNATPTELHSILLTNTGTEFHYAGTAAMLPLNLGGVVDSNLTVYGTSNLRVVDTSVFPIVPGAHTMSVAYAVAERGSDLVKESWVEGVVEGEGVEGAENGLKGEGGGEQGDGEEVVGEDYLKWLFETVGVEGKVEGRVRREEMEKREEKFREVDRRARARRLKALAEQDLAVRGHALEEDLNGLSDAEDVRELNPDWDPNACPKWWQEDWIECLESSGRWKVG